MLFYVIDKLSQSCTGKLEGGRLRWQEREGGRKKEGKGERREGTGKSEGGC